MFLRFRGLYRKFTVTIEGGALVLLEMGDILENIYLETIYQSNSLDFFHLEIGLS